MGGKSWKGPRAKLKKDDVGKLNESQWTKLRRNVTLVLQWETSCQNNLTCRRTNSIGGCFHLPREFSWRRAIRFLKQGMRHIDQTAENAREFTAVAGQAVQLRVKAGSDLTNPALNRDKLFKEETSDCAMSVSATTNLSSGSRNVWNPDVLGPVS